MMGENASIRRQALTDKERLAGAPLRIQANGKGRFCRFDNGNESPGVEDEAETVDAESVVVQGGGA